MAMIVYVMGVAGSGKTTVGRLLASKLGIPFYDGDDFHQEAHRKKMAAGNALTDEDRAGWLKTIGIAAQKAAQQSGAVIACSALRQIYRYALQEDLSHCRWIYLKGEAEIIRSRLRARSGHFFPETLLNAQFDLLEEPSYALKLSIDHPAETLADLAFNHLQSTKQFGLIGLGVMGKSLARNMGSHGVSLALYNRHVPEKEEHIAAVAVNQHEALRQAAPFDDLDLFMASIERPAKILMMLPAGNPTDEMLTKLMPYLRPNDILIDGGNAHYEDTRRRQQQLAALGIAWIGLGISGGEAGALHGPAMMAGGNQEAWLQVKDMLQQIAAQTTDGAACCTYVSTDGAGHFVKMVHNGIEYAEMQLLAELYHLLRFGMRWSMDQVQGLFSRWQSSELSSYLLDITTAILAKRHDEGYLLDAVSDEASSKGTGTWATQVAAQLGVPSGMLTISLFVRHLSLQRTLRQELLTGLRDTVHAEPIVMQEQIVFDAYRLARMVNHHQGFYLIRAAAEAFGWRIDLAQLATTWSNGCIIRSELMNGLRKSFISEGPELLLHQSMKYSYAKTLPALQEVLATTISAGLALPVFSEALQYLLMLRTEALPTNLIQAQRDCFGAHTFTHRLQPDGPALHADWLTP